MRRFFGVSLIPLTLVIGVASAQAAVQITVDKSAQQMTVSVDGVPRYTWPVSSGRPDYETPNGTFKAFRMEAEHYSKEFDDAPMPHSIFFTKIGHAIHGTFEERRLGAPVSHGCVRLSRQHASTLYALVEKEGVLNTTVTLTGSARIALARGLKPRGEPGESAVAQQGPLPITPTAQQRYVRDDDFYRGQVGYVPRAVYGYRGGYQVSDDDDNQLVPPAATGSLFAPRYPAYSQPRYYSPRGY
jgi:hypothetical protein